jgi:type II secretory pathway pseudopilin PulG
MKLTHLRRRWGFTLPDLLVAVALGGLGLTLLAPIIQKGRSKEDRTKCLNHFKQMGLAVHNFYDTNGVFPTSPGGDDALGGGGIAYTRDGVSNRK